MKKRLEQLLDFQKENPQDPFLKYAIASEYVKLGDLDQGLRAFQNLVHEDPNYIGTYYHLAKLYEQLNQQEAAAETYLKGITLAQEQRNRHALGELQAAYQQLLGEDEDDYD